MYCFSCKSQENDNSQVSKEKKAAIELDYRIWNIFHDSKGNYWFGSRDKGVFYYDGKTLHQYTTKDGLLDNAIRGV